VSQKFADKFGGLLRDPDVSNEPPEKTPTDALTSAASESILRIARVGVDARSTSLDG
jgi:hypothetical protein